MSSSSIDLEDFSYSFICVIQCLWVPCHKQNSLWASLFTVHSDAAKLYTKTWHGPINYWLHSQTMPPRWVYKQSPKSILQETCNLAVVTVCPIWSSAWQDAKLNGNHNSYVLARDYSRITKSQPGIELKFFMYALPIADTIGGICPDWVTVSEKLTDTVETVGVEWPMYSDGTISTQEPVSWLWMRSLPEHTQVVVPRRRKLWLIDFAYSANICTWTRGRLPFLWFWGIGVLDTAVALTN